MLARLGAGRVVEVDHLDVVAVLGQESQAFGRGGAQLEHHGAGAARQPFGNDRHGGRGEDLAGGAGVGFGVFFCD